MPVPSHPFYLCTVKLYAESNKSKTTRIVAWVYAVSHGASQVETLFSTLEDIDQKLEALGVIEV